MIWALFRVHAHVTDRPIHTMVFHEISHAFLIPAAGSRRMFMQENPAFSQLLAVKFCTEVQVESCLMHYSAHFIWVHMLMVEPLI